METIEINKANEEFWNELCGTSFAKYLGINDHSAGSLKKFDKGYFDLYPYLLKHVDLSFIQGKRVMEVGLGYGTLGQRIAESAEEYVGLDIADGPVRMMNHRLQMRGLKGQAFKGSILNCPLDSNSLDCVVSIGCFHHTGDVKRCIDEVHRVLKPGGKLFMMVYNRYSFRQWTKWPKETFLYLLNEYGLSKKFSGDSNEQIKAYDADSRGIAAPETVFLSIKQIKKLLKSFINISCHKENCDDLLLVRGGFIPRLKLLPYLGKVAGLDIYVTVTKLDE